MSLNLGKEEEQELSKKMNNISNDIIESRGRMDKIIKELESELKNDQNDENADPNIIKDDSDLRLKKNLFDAMIKKYQNVIQKFLIVKYMIQVMNFVLNVMKDII